MVIGPMPPWGKCKATAPSRAISRASKNRQGPGLSDGFRRAARITTSAAPQAERASAKAASPRPCQRRYPLTVAACPAPSPAKAVVRPPRVGSQDPHRFQARDPPRTPRRAHGSAHAGPPHPSPPQDALKWQSICLVAGFGPKSKGPPPWARERRHAQIWIGGCGAAIDTFCALVSLLRSA